MAVFVLSLKTKFCDTSSKNRNSDLSRLSLNFVLKMCKIKMS